MSLQLRGKQIIIFIPKKKKYYSTVQYLPPSLPEHLKFIPSLGCSLFQAEMGRSRS